MKNEKMIEILDLADDKYIEECAPKGSEKRNKKGSKRLTSILVAACLLILMTALCLWLFLPLRLIDDTAGEYRDYEYYNVIKAIEGNFDHKDMVSDMRNPVYKNNFEKYILSKIKGEEWFKNPVERVDFSATDTSDQEQNYFEVTDNEVSGVIEYDYLKLTDKYAFYGGQGLSVIKCDGENSEEISCSEKGSGQILLTNDCKSVIQVGWNKLWLHDVSDVEEIETKSDVGFSGEIQSARLYGEKLIVTVWQGQPKEKDRDYGNKDTYVPYAVINGEKIYVPSKDIKVLDYNGWRVTMNYVSVWLFDANTLEFKDCKAIIAPARLTAITDYVTEDKIFLAYYYYEENLNSDRNVLTSGTYTDIVCYSYGDELKYKGDIKVNCTVDGRYMMSEKDGILRIAAGYSEKIRKREGDEIYFDWLGETKKNACVVCIDIESWKTVGRIDGFMPKDERLQSVRFEGDLCYVCTAKVIKAPYTVKVLDPVFCFDLSNPKKITYKDTGEIVGYSSSMVRMGDYLLGIGVGETGEDFKLELFKETEDAIVSVDTYLERMEYISNTYPGYSEDYKDYYIDKENCLIGFLLNQKYTLMSIRDGKFEVVFTKENGNYCNHVRGFYRDGWFYIFTHIAETVIPVKVDIG